jgi:hypothetical protein
MEVSESINELSLIPAFYQSQTVNMQSGLKVTFIPIIGNVARLPPLVIAEIIKGLNGQCANMHSGSAA